MTERTCSRTDVHAEHDWIVTGDPFRIGISDQPCHCPGRLSEEPRNLWPFGRWNGTGSTSHAGPHR